MPGSDGRRIGGKGGGSSKGKPKGAGGAAAVVLAGAVAMGAVGSGGLGGAGGGAGGGVADGAAARSVSARKVEGQRAARKGDVEGAWQRLGMRGWRQTVKQQAECVVASFGRVQEYFRGTRCASMDRVLFAVVDGAGNTAVVSVVWVGFGSAGDAAGFKSVIDQHGSGDVRPLGGAALGLAEVSFTGLNYGSDRDGKTVVVAEAERIGGSVDPAVLDALAEVAACLPRP
ncbi:hypothetical protein ABZ816_04095 [Actinosynnema sp. NPDC047251]|uniref:Putative secreted protein n=1 Tax=Saccharothrix espanaensis (strain ATCC 51144 / DSM 44229 / JCM 9112 / NBRC 15066 / NRRL 15764) TaxID=1179773 RepID=K0K3H5_SACES|nr:hypothetical protein [Saccharothrix espanaensis]CCH31444.1 putative secreted protein [Saccharothrix espanaensis DSM 44229]